MRRHRQLRRLLDAYVDGELRDPEARALADHLLGCPECARDAATTAQIRVVLARLADEEPPPLATARLRHFASSLTSLGR